jgi:hypothetical protein
MKTLRSTLAGAALLALPAEAQEHRFESDPIVVVRENFVACDVLSQLQRVMDSPRFLLTGECDPLRAGDRVRVYARRGPYVCIDPHDMISPANGRMMPIHALPINPIATEALLVLEGLMGQPLQLRRPRPKSVWRT